MEMKKGSTQAEFDFEAAVAEARRDFPRETANITFVDLGVTGAAETLWKWFNENYGSDLDDDKLLFNDDAYLRKLGIAKYCPATRKSLLTVNTRPSHTPDMPRQFILDHELGHLIVPGAISRDDTSPTSALAQYRGELLADSFAVLRGLQRGTLTREEAEGLSLRRALSSDCHLTTRGIDETLARTADIDCSALRPRDLLELARTCAEAAMTDERDLSLITRRMRELATGRRAEREPDEIRPQRLKEIFSKPKDTLPHRGEKLTHVQWLENMADISAAYPKGSLAAYVSTRVMAAALDSGQLVGFGNKEKMFEVEGPGWDKIRRDVAQRAKKNGVPLMTAGKPR